MLGTVRFAGRPDGWTEVSTVALLDGPFSGGRVIGLRVPISGRFGAGGALRFGEHCLDTRFASLTAGALRLGPTRLPLCPVGGAIVQRRTGGEWLSASPRGASACAGAWANRRSRSTRPRPAIGGERFTATRHRGPDGQPDSPVADQAQTLAGNLSGGGAQRHVHRRRCDRSAGFRCKLSEASGNWRVRNGGVTVDGGLTVSDLADPSEILSAAQRRRAFHHGRRR